MKILSEPVWVAMPHDTCHLHIFLKIIGPTNQVNKSNTGRIRGSVDEALQMSAEIPNFKKNIKTLDFSQNLIRNETLMQAA